MTFVKFSVLILLFSSLVQAHEIVGYDNQPGLRPHGMPPVLTENHQDQLCFDIRGIYKVHAKSAAGGDWPDRIANQNFETGLIGGDLFYFWWAPMFEAHGSKGIKIKADGRLNWKSEDTNGVHYLVICDREGVNIMTMIDSTRFIERMRIFPSASPKVFNFQFADDRAWGSYGTFERQ